MGHSNNKGKKIPQYESYRKANSQSDIFEILQHDVAYIKYKLNQFSKADVVANFIGALKSLPGYVLYSLTGSSEKPNTKLLYNSSEIAEIYKQTFEIEYRKYILEIFNDFEKYTKWKEDYVSFSSQEANKILHKNNYNFSFSTHYTYKIFLETLADFFNAKKNIPNFEELKEDLAILQDSHYSWQSTTMQSEIQAFYDCYSTYSSKIILKFNS